MIRSIRYGCLLLRGLHPRLLAALVIAGSGLAGCGSATTGQIVGGYNTPAATSAPAAQPSPCPSGYFLALSECHPIVHLRPLLPFRRIKAICRALAGPTDADWQQTLNDLQADIMDWYDCDDYDSSGTETHDWGINALTGKIWKQF